MRRETRGWKCVVSLCIMSGVLASFQSGCSSTSPKRYQGLTGGGTTSNGAGDGAGAMIFMQSKATAKTDRYVATAREP